MYQVSPRTLGPRERNGQTCFFEARLGEAVQLVFTAGCIVGFRTLTSLLASGFRSLEVRTQEDGCLFLDQLEYLCFFDRMDWPETGTKKKFVFLVDF